MVSFLLSLDFMDLNSKNSEGKSLLTIALESEKLQIAILLSDFPITVQENDLALALKVINKSFLNIKLSS